MISGAMMFPAYNNRLVPSQADAELSATGCHVSQGGGPHCHAEGCESQGVLGVYNDAEYKGKDSQLEGFGAAADSCRVRSLIVGAHKDELTGTPYFVRKNRGTMQRSSAASTRLRGIGATAIPTRPLALYIARRFAAAHRLCL